MEIASRKTLWLQKKDNWITIFTNWRKKNIISNGEFACIRDELISNTDYNGTTFFQNLSNIFFNVALPNVLNFWLVENSNYADVVFNSKNVYLSFTATSEVENILYTFRCTWNCKNVLWSFSIMNNCENVYSSIIVSDSYNIFYSQNISNSSDIWFGKNLIWCSECIQCADLQNKKYCINNVEFEKEEYYKKKNEILSKKLLYIELRDNVYSIPYANLNADNSEGIGLINVSNVKNAMFVTNLNTGSNVFWFWTPIFSERMYDICMSWSWTDYFWCCDVWRSEQIYCSTQMAFCNNCFYCYLLENCSFCLGCIGLKNKSYCILNKQYTKEERYIEVDRIFWQMYVDWTLWDFFPAMMNPFYFNDTAAYLIDPTFTKEEVTAKWYLRRDDPIKVDIPDFMDVVKSNELDKYEWWKDDVRTIDPSILKKIIIDEEWNSYRIIKMEYDFLMKHGLPLPRKHWLERMKENFRIN